MVTRSFVVASVAVAAAVEIGLAAPAAACSWTIPFTPNGTKNPNTLVSISADSATDAWAAGYHIDEVNDNDPLVLHWDGSKWTLVVHSPKYPVRPPVYLYGIDALSPTNVWTVGQSSPGLTLIMHWDGAKWANSPSVGIVGATNVLSSIFALNAGDMWSVGSATTALGTAALAEHWDGAAWTLIAAANPTSANVLQSVWGSASNDVWAVGYGLRVKTPHKRTLIEHWDGSRWSAIPSPNATLADNILNSVSGTSPNDVWAVGIYDAGGVWATLAEHWDGSTWTVVKTPNRGTSGSELLSVAAASAGDVWAVGQSFDGSIDSTLAMQWNGSKWAIVSSPNKQGNSSWLNAVTILPGSGSPDAAGAYLSSTSRTLNLLCR